MTYALYQWFWRRETIIFLSLFFFWSTLGRFSNVDKTTSPFSWLHPFIFLLHVFAVFVVYYILTTYSCILLLIVLYHMVTIIRNYIHTATCCCIVVVLYTRGFATCPDDYSPDNRETETQSGRREKQTLVIGGIGAGELICSFIELCQ